MRHSRKLGGSVGARRCSSLPVALFSDVRGWHPVVMGSIYSRLFALCYDSFLAWGERAGMQTLRQKALAEATGFVLEIGAGTGLNAALLPADVERISLSEPDPAMRHRLSQRLASLGRRLDILDAPAHHLPVDSGAVDTVVSTLVLCTVADLEATLAEIRRVLSPEGRLILIEHVRAAEPRLRAWQDRLHGPWMAFAEGCHCNRDTVAALRDAGFDTARLQVARWKRMPPIVSPLVFGSLEPHAGVP
jgi:ubiquinone/menaquinone biosynthesis C-methylase UbiE